ncbi:MAG: hypothetical protein WC648_00640 [Candidatus Paceibacterota bacterium]
MKFRVCYVLENGLQRTEFRADDTNFRAKFEEATRFVQCSSEAKEMIANDFYRLPETFHIFTKNGDGLAHLQLVPEATEVSEKKPEIRPVAGSGVFVGHSAFNTDDWVFRFANNTSLTTRVVEWKYKRKSLPPGWQEARTVWCQFQLGRKLGCKIEKKDDSDSIGNNKISTFRLSEDGNSGDWVEGPYGPTVLIRAQKSGTIVGQGSYRNSNDGGRTAESGFHVFNPGEIVI